MDFYVEFIVHPTSSTGAIAYINFKDSTTNNLLSIGDIYSNANCGVNWTNGTFSGKAIDTDVDTKVTATRRGTSITLTVGDSTFNVSNMPISCDILVNAGIDNNSIKDFIIYPI